MQLRRVFGNYKTQVVDFAFNEMKNRALILTHTELVVFCLNTNEPVNRSRVATFFHFHTSNKTKSEVRVDQLESLSRLSLWLVLFDLNKVVVFNDKFSRSNVFMVDYLVSSILVNTSRFELVLCREEKQLKFFRLQVFPLENKIKPVRMEVGEDQATYDQEVWFDHIGYRLKPTYISLRDIYLAKSYRQARIEEVLGLAFFLLKNGDMVVYDASDSQVHLSLEKMDILAFDIFQENLYTLSPTKFYIYNMFHKDRHKEISVRRHPLLSPKTSDLKLVVLLSSFFPLVYIVEKNLTVHRLDHEENTCALNPTARRPKNMRMSDFADQKKVLKEIGYTGITEFGEADLRDRRRHRPYLYYHGGNLTLLTIYLRCVEKLTMVPMHRLSYPLSDFRKISNLPSHPGRTLGMITMTYEVEVVDIPTCEVVSSFRLFDYKQFSPEQIYFIDYNHFDDLLLVQRGRPLQIFKPQINHVISVREKVFVGAPNFVRYNPAEAGRPDLTITFGQMTNVQAKYTIAVIQSSYAFIFWVDFVIQEIKHLKTVVKFSEIVEAEFAGGYLVLCEAEGRISYTHLTTFEPEFVVKFSYPEISRVLVDGDRVLYGGTKYGDIEQLSFGEEAPTTIRHSFKYHLERIISLRLTQTGSDRFLFSFSNDRVLAVWDLTLKRVHMVFQFDLSVVDILYSHISDFYSFVGDIYMLSLSGVMRVPAGWATVSFNFLTNSEYQKYHQSTMKEAKRQYFDILATQRDIGQLRTYYSFASNVLSYTALSHREQMSGRFLTSLFFQVWTADFNFQNVRCTNVLDDFVIFDTWMRQAYPAGFFKTMGMYFSCVSPVVGKILGKVNPKYNVCADKEIEVKVPGQEFRDLISKPFQKSRPKSVFESLVRQSWGN